MAKEVGFEPTGPRGPAVFKTAAFTRTLPLLQNGAGGKSRTPDLMLTRQLLYQLSYAGVLGAFSGFLSRQFTNDSGLFNGG